MGASPTTSQPKKIGVALGSGSARGFAHIGVLQELREMGIHPDVVCGASTGTLVGGALLLERLTVHFKLHAKLGTPGLFDVLAGSINIMQDRLTSSRLADHPPDVKITPHLAQIGLLEFDRALRTLKKGTRQSDASHPNWKGCFEEANRPAAYLHFTNRLPLQVAQDTMDKLLSFVSRRTLHAFFETSLCRMKKR